MMKKFILLFYSAYLLPASHVQAWELADTEIFGRIKWEAAQQTTSGSLQKNEQNFDLELLQPMGEVVTLKAIVRGIHETKLETTHLADVDLREFYLDLSLDWGKFRLGRQQVVWGKTDGLKLLDLINPQDFREFILDDFIDSRIPLWMVRSDFYVGDDTVQLLIIPDIRSHEMPGAGDRFEPVWLKGVRLLPQGNDDRPNDTLSNAEAGLRYSGFAGGWDYTLNAFYTWEDAPLFFNNARTMIRKYKRAKMAGGSFSKAFGSFVFRGETAYNFDKYFTTMSLTDADGQVEKDEGRLAFGLDYTKGDWLISGQLFESYIAGHEGGIVLERNSTMATLLVSVNLFNETLELKLLDIYGTDNKDNLARFTAAYSITDSWKLKGGLAFFNGPTNAFLGQFGDADRAEAELILNF